MENRKKINTKKLVLLAVLTAMVVLLQMLAIFMRPLFPMFTVSLVLMPIVIGAALAGKLAGLWLGFAFGLVVLISGDANAFFVIHPAGTVITVLLKGALAGLACGIVYKALEEKNKTLAALAAAVTCPLVNTGIFTLGGYVFFLETLTNWGMDAGFTNVAAFIFVGMIGVNFLLELGLNVVLCPAIIRLIQYGQKTAL